VRPRRLWPWTLLLALVSCIGSRPPGVGSAPRPCTTTADCPTGLMCLVGICSRPGTVALGDQCLATRDCVMGLYCDPTKSVCAVGGTGEGGASCRTDADCAPPLYCGQTGLSRACTPPGNGNLNDRCATTQDCLAGLYCGQGSVCKPYGDAFPPFPGVTCTDEGPFRAYFEVPRPSHPPADFFRLPFPNDVRVTDGALDITDFPRPGLSSIGVDVVDLYADTWTADFDGFSGIAGISFRFSAAIDFATATSAAVLLIDVTPGASALIPRTWTVNDGRTKFSCPNTLTVHPWTDAPLSPRHTYAAIVTAAIRSKAGEAPAPDADLVALLGAARPDDATLAHAWDAYAPLRTWLAANPTALPPIAGAAVFTVQDAPGHMARLAGDLATRPAPSWSALTLCGPGVTSPCDDGTPDRACGTSDDFYEVHGRFTVPIYQKGTAPYDTPAAGGGIAEVNGGPRPVRTEAVCFALALPKGTPPAGGWPLVVYHHGTGGSMRSAILDGTAATLTGGKTPAALFGFDAVEHGARRGGSSKSPDELVFNPLNPRAARDNLLQGAVDVLQALRLPTVPIPAAASPTGAAIAFDPGVVLYFGHSQGSSSGELALPFTAVPGAAVLSGAGAFVTMSLLDKTMPTDIGAGLSDLLGEPLSPDHPVMTIFQSFFDRADPVHYNPLIIKRPLAGIPAKHVYMSWGKGDSYAPRSTLEANARSLQVPPVAPLVEGYNVEPIVRPVRLNFASDSGLMRTAAVFQYAPDGYDGHFVAQESPAAIADWSAFASSYFATGTPTVSLTNP
jgi:hypothetical protein